MPGLKRILRKGSRLQEQLDPSSGFLCSCGDLSRRCIEMAAARLLCNRVCALQFYMGYGEVACSEEQLFDVGSSTARWASPLH